MNNPKEKKKKTMAEKSDTMIGWQRVLALTSSGIIKAMESTEKRQEEKEAKEAHEAAKESASAKHSRFSEDEDYAFGMMAFQQMKAIPESYDKVLFRNWLLQHIFNYRRNSTQSASDLSNIGHYRPSAAPQQIVPGLGSSHGLYTHPQAVQTGFYPSGHSYSSHDSRPLAAFTSQLQRLQPGRMRI